MGAKNPPDERVVYLALKKVFKGPSSGVRRLAAIRKLITENKHHSDIATLISAHSIDILCNTARTLLTERIFESTLNAKIRFPEVFDVTPAQSADREASGAVAAKNDAKAIQNAVQGHQEDPSNVARLGADAGLVKNGENHQPSTPEPQNHIPSLFPVYLPFRAQHRLLGKVQAILERACFEFAQHTMPDVLTKNRWDCPESTELNLWALEFLRHQSKFSEKERSVGKPFGDLFHSAADIRHTAVHRVRLSAKGVEQFLLDAENLAMLLKNVECLKLLTKLRRDTQSAIEELERNKHVLRSKLEDTLERIAVQQAELACLERAAIVEMVKEDGEYQALAGTNLEQAIESSDADPVAAAAQQQETSSEMNDTDSAEELGESSLARCQD